MHGEKHKAANVSDRPSECEVTLGAGRVFASLEEAGRQETTSEKGAGSMVRWCHVYSLNTHQKYDLKRGINDSFGPVDTWSFDRSGDRMGCVDKKKGNRFSPIAFS